MSGPQAVKRRWSAATRQIGRDRRVVEEAASAFGHLDGLINNAGAMVARTLYEEMTDDYYDAVMDLNARSVVAASKAAIAHLKKQGGFIVNTTSVAARTGGTAGSGVYGSSKAFVGAVTRAWRWNSANMASASMPSRRFHRNALPGEICAAGPGEKVAAAVPLGRPGTAQDCVGAYLFLASDLLSGYVTGQTIDVNGGQ